MNPDQGTELRNGKIINSSLETPSPADPDMAQTSSNDSDTNEASDISSQLSELKENYERKINELQSEFSQLKNLLMAVIVKNDENNYLRHRKVLQSRPTEWGSTPGYYPRVEQVIFCRIKWRNLRCGGAKGIGFQTD